MTYSKPFFPSGHHYSTQKAEGAVDPRLLLNLVPRKPKDEEEDQEEQEEQEEECAEEDCCILIHMPSQNCGPFLSIIKQSI